MKKKPIVIILVFFGLLFILPLILGKKESIDKVTESEQEPVPVNAISIPETIKVEGVSEPLLFDTYIMGVIAAEMPASFDMEALKAQAVAARTYALYQTELLKNPIQTTTAHQVYFPVNNLSTQYEQKVREAVEMTKDLVLLHNNEIICAMFHAASNGMTESAENFSGTSLPYLKSVPSPEKKVTVHRFSLSELNHLLQTKLSIEMIKNAQIIRNSTNRIHSISINNQSWTGREFREKLSLASTDFNIQINDGVIEIEANGYGHGVGLSQIGAQELALSGYTFEEILSYYYKDVELKKYEEIVE